MKKSTPSIGISVLLVILTIYAVFFYSSDRGTGAGYAKIDSKALNIFNSFTLYVGYTQIGGASCMPQEPQELANELKNHISNQLAAQGYKDVRGQVSKEPYFDQHPLALKITVAITSTPTSKSAAYKLRISRGKIFDHFWKEKNPEKFRSEIFAMSQQEFDRQYRAGNIGSEYLKNDIIDCAGPFSPSVKEIAEEIISPIDKLWKPDPILAAKLEEIIHERTQKPELTDAQQR